MGSWGDNWGHFLGSYSTNLICLLQNKRLFSGSTWFLFHVILEANKQTIKQSEVYTNFHGSPLGRVDHNTLQKNIVAEVTLEHLKYKDDA